MDPIHSDSSSIRHLRFNEQEVTKMKQQKPTDSRKVAAALILWARAATTCLSSKKRKTAAMKRRLKDLKMLDIGGV